MYVDGHGLILWMASISSKSDVLIVFFTLAQVHWHTLPGKPHGSHGFSIFARKNS